MKTELFPRFYDIALHFLWESAKITIVNHSDLANSFKSNCECLEYDALINAEISEEAFFRSLCSRHVIKIAKDYIFSD